jgi:hypothetical protein
VVHNARLAYDTVWNWFMKRHDRYGPLGGLLLTAGRFSALAAQSKTGPVFVKYGFEPLH